jgi:uncharacterized repeat protein (TIGR01451 family)
VTSPPSSARIDTVAAGALSLTKIADPDSVTEAGQQVVYRYVVTNTGDLSITGLTVTDTTFTGTGTPPVIFCPTNNLAPGAQTICTGTYTVTQADVNAGIITNTGIARGTGSDGSTITSPPSTANVDIPAAPSLALVKSADPTAITAAGQQISYTFQVINTGNVTLNGVLVEETIFTGSGTSPVISCPATSLAPAQEMTCTARYTVTAADMNADNIRDTAVARATTPAVSSPPSSATVDITARSTLSAVKTAEPSMITAAGQQITYRVTVTNTGTATLTNVTVNDTSFTGTGVPPVFTCPPAAAALPPGGTVVCTATYIVPETDLGRGFITNTAVASARTPDGSVVTSPPTQAVVKVDNAPKPPKKPHKPKHPR